MMVSQLVNYSIKMSYTGGFSEKFKTIITRIVTDNEGKLLSVGQPMTGTFPNRDAMFNYVMKKETKVDAVVFEKGNMLYNDYEFYKKQKQEQLQKASVQELEDGYQRTTTLQEGAGVFEGSSLLLSNAHKVEQVFARYKSGFTQKEFIIRLEERGFRGEKNHIDYHFDLVGAKKLVDHLDASIKALEKAKELALI